MTYCCNDSKITAQPESLTNAWHNAYLIFLENSSRRGEESTEGKDSHPSPDAASQSGHIGAEQPSEGTGDDGEGNEGGSEDEEDEEEEEDEGEGEDEEEEEGADDEPCNLQAKSCRITSTRHGDWLHRGPTSPISRGKST